MTTWRLPTRDEQLADFVRLSRFLSPRIAARIAAMPIVVSAPEIPWAIRADAWLWRTRPELLAGERFRTESEPLDVARIHPEIAA